MWAHDENDYELSERSGVPQSTIYRFRKGKHTSISPVTVQKLAAAYSLNESQFRGDLPLPLEAQQLVASYEVKIPHSTLPNSSTSPRGSAQKSTLSNRHLDQHQPHYAALITWEEAVEMLQEDPAADNAREQVLYPGPAGGRVVCIKVVDDSMRRAANDGPTFPVGHLLFFDLTLSPSLNDYVLVKTNDGTAFRQLVSDAGDWMLLPLNPSFRSRAAPVDRAEYLGVLIYATPPASFSRPAKAI